MKPSSNDNQYTGKISKSIFLKFNDLNDLISKNGIQPKSLNPDKEVPTPFSELLESLSDQNPNQDNLELIYHFFDGCINSIIRNYPENIFWDLDFLFYYIYNQLDIRLDYNSKKNWLLAIESRVEHIMEIFGFHSKIQFRYIHDFLYGFDWCKWSRNQKWNEEDRDYNPFGEEFLSYIENRGIEIQEMVESQDENYVQIESGKFRNPFVFKRGTQEEIALLSSLAETGDIPIFAWKMDAKYNSKKDYSQIRKDRAVKLGIAPNRMPGAHKHT